MVQDGAQESHSPIRTGFAVAPGPLMVPAFAAVSHRPKFGGWSCLGAGCLLTAYCVW